MWSKDVLLNNIYINSTSHNSQPALNTDGVDTLYSDNITFRNMYIRNGDDAIAIKGNSNNILVEDSTFDNSLGLAFGSLGQYIGETELVENITACQIKFDGTRYASYVKTWTGDQVNYPPNGGGGGLGNLRNITLYDFELIDVEKSPFAITQCATFSGGNPDCESSLFKISDITLREWTEHANSSYVVDMNCSRDSGGCENITIENMNLNRTGTSDNIVGYRCRDVSPVSGFTCT